ncbi:MAG: transposase, partial [Oscillospiraceae bacterium]|nr:transposase [Oscillospiraceae bacterium]
MSKIRDKSRICYIDECGVEEFMERPLARAPRGERVFLERSGKRFGRTNIVAGLYDGEVIAQDLSAGSMTGERFELWLNWRLCPALYRGSVLILDNASFHRKRHVEAIAKRFGHKVL